MSGDRLILSQPSGSAGDLQASMVSRTLELADLKKQASSASGLVKQIDDLSKLTELSPKLKQQREVLAQDLKKNRERQEQLKVEQRQDQARLAALKGRTRHVAHVDAWKAVSTAPDLCKVGNSVVAFDSSAVLSTPVQSSPNVKARGTPVYRQGDLMAQTQGNAGQHVESGTSLGAGFVKILEGHDKVVCNGLPIARHDSLCKVNCNAQGQGGAMGKLVTEDKSVSSSAPAGSGEVPPGQRSSPRLEQLKARRDALASGQLDLNALDEYVDFKSANGVLDGAIGSIKGDPGTLGDYAAQATRGVLGFVKDAGMGIGELAYEGIKAVPKMARSMYTPTGQELQTLDAQILAENLRLGNITPGTVGSGALQIGKAIIKPVTEPWSKGQYVEAGTRAVAEVGTLFAGAITKLGKLGEAGKAAEVLNTAGKADDVADAAKVAEAADAGKAADAAEAGKGGDGVHVAAAKSGALRELLERKWGKLQVEEALKAKRADPKLDALLTDDEYLSIRAYTSNLYKEINPALRAGNVGEWSGLTDEAASGMSKLSKNGYGFDGIVRRDAYFTDAEIAKIFGSPGGTFSDKAFLSTTSELNGVFPGNTSIYINGSSGVRVAALSEYATEAEVLFSPGTNFRVIDISKGASGNTIVRLEEIVH